jgi:tRNA pseudouridine38-40 synthase
VIDVEAVAESFNARFSARLKTYRYQIWNGPVVSPFFYRYAHHHRNDLDTREMQRAARLLVGTHDFSAFTVQGSEIEDRVRALKYLDLRREESRIIIVVAADGFLRYMVRTIVGTLIEVGSGRRTAESVASVLESRDRRNAGAKAPACGLTLMRVDY